MNRLTNETVWTFYRPGITPKALRARWRDLLKEDRRIAADLRRARKGGGGASDDGVGKKALGVEHHTLYAILQGKDWRRGFTPCTNAVKVANGQTRWASATRTLLLIHDATRSADLGAPFGDLLADDCVAAARRLLPKGQRWLWEADLDTTEAYLDEPRDADV